MTPAVDKIPKYIPQHYKDDMIRQAQDWQYYTGTTSTKFRIDTSYWNNDLHSTGDWYDTTQTQITSSYNPQSITVQFDGGTDQLNNVTAHAIQEVVEHIQRHGHRGRPSPMPDPYIAPPPPPRRSPPREFNKYINGSDLVEEFIRYCGTLNVRQGEVLEIPIDSFIKWLIIEACVVDKEEPEVTLELGPSPQPRCLGCGRYVKRSLAVPLHNERCAGFHFARQRKQMEVAHVQGTGGSGSGDRRVLSDVGAPIPGGTVQP